MSLVGFRCARPTSDLEALKRFYVDGLGCSPIGRFDGHDGFDGLIVGAPDGATVDAAGFHRVSPNNPYWARQGVTDADPDGYHVVIAVPHGS